MPVQVVYITAALLFLGALPLPLPPAFNEFLKMVAFGTFAWGAYTNFGKTNLLLPLAYSLLAILFNPIMEITLPREYWIGIDLAAAILLLATKRRIAP
ncbi:MAG: hypothetical protein HGB23_03560 [Chlorobiaceae bacterium]|nr:hypothetical protein [Chlorobiaceae bacterium]